MQDMHDFLRRKHTVIEEGRVVAYMQITSIDLASAHREGWTEQICIYVKNLGDTTVSLDARALDRG